MSVLLRFGKDRLSTAKDMALEALGANIMIADAELNITYMNPAVIALLKQAEVDLQKELPRFTVATLIGSNIDIFHKHPAHQRKLLADLRKPLNATIWIGKRAFDLLVSPLIEKRTRIGFVVAWADAKERLLNLDYAAQIAAIGKVQAVVEFTVDGVIQNANENFLKAMGYSLEEVRGKHHSMFIERGLEKTPDYVALWEDLRRGEYRAGQFKRIGKGGKEVWIEGSYNPIFDVNGKVSKVVKFAADITAQMQLLANLKVLIDKNFGEIGGAIERSSSQTRLAADAVHKTTGDVQTMAAAAEELAASVREITSMMAKSSAATKSAHAQASQAGAAIQRLTETSAAMGGIVALIRSIAGQINLLALNATIESARAGEAGRGFAVVAGEVKNLAQQAANATNQIAKEIEQLQAVSGEVAGALTGIGGAIDSIREFVGATASAVEEQSAVTQGLSSGMQTTATTIVAINDNMNEISKAVNQVAHTVNDTKSAAQVLVR